jgi:hypothetical protein
MVKPVSGHRSRFALAPRPRRPGCCADIFLILPTLTSLVRHPRRHKSRCTTTFGGPTSKYGARPTKPRRASLGAQQNVTSRKVIRLSPAHPQRRVAPRSKSRASSRHATLDRLAPLPRRPLVAMPSTRVHATRRQDRGLAGAALPRARAPSFLACCPCSRRRVTLYRSL